MLYNNSNNSNLIELLPKSVIASSSSSSHGWAHITISSYIAGYNGATISEPCIHRTGFINLASLWPETFYQTSWKQLFDMESTSWGWHTCSECTQRSGQSSHSIKVENDARISWRKSFRWIWSMDCAISDDFHLVSLHHLRINVTACSLLQTRVWRMWQYPQLL